MLRFTPFLLLAALPFLATGCTKSLNSSVVVFDDDAGSTIVGTEATPSLNNGHAREHWPRVAVDVPEKTVEVEPDYIDEYVLANDTARQKGWYPTAHSVFEEDRDHTTHALEAALQTPHAIGSVILIPFEMLICQRRPGEVEHAPTSDYQRILPPRQTADAMIREVETE